MVKMSFLTASGAKIPLADLIYPVGAIYITTSVANPATYLGGTWERYAKGRCLVGVNENETEFATVEKTGGHKNMQQHTHKATTKSAGAHTHLVGMGDTDSGGSGYARMGYNNYQYRGVMTESGAHSHTVTVEDAGSGNAENLQPYISVFIWRRTA